MNREQAKALADAATVVLPLLVIALLLLLFLLVPLANRYRKAMRHLRHEAYPLRLARELVEWGQGGVVSGVGRPLEHREEDEEDEDDAAAAAAAGDRPVNKKKKRPIYLDWNATSQVYPEVALRMLPYLYSRCGNPGSAHAYGLSPRAEVARARAAVAAVVGAESPEEIVFASCGTEAINWALRGGIRAGWKRRREGEEGGEGEGEEKGRRPHVITTAVEHPAVLVLLQRLEAEGAIDLDVLGVCSEGLLCLPEFAAAIRPDTVLAAVMHANNETGALQPIAEVAALCRAKDVLLFVDGAQSIGKVPVDVGVGGALGGPDMLAVVGHKFGAPKGVAALYVRRGLELEPMLVGGGQERGRRSGTECVLLIAGLGEAAAIVQRELSALQAHLRACTELLRERLVAELGDAGLRFNGPIDPARRLPNTLSVSFRGLHGPRLVAALAGTVALSAGSACHAHGPALTPSPVLEAMRVPTEDALGTLRLSCGRHTTAEEVRRAARLIAGAVREEKARVEEQGEGAVVTP